MTELCVWMLKLWYSLLLLKKETVDAYLDTDVKYLPSIAKISEKKKNLYFNEKNYTGCKVCL